MQLSPSSQIQDIVYQTFSFAVNYGRICASMRPSLRRKPQRWPDCRFDHGMPMRMGNATFSSTKGCTAGVSSCCTSCGNPEMNAANLRTKLALLVECNVRMWEYGNEKMGILRKCESAQVRRGYVLAFSHFSHVRNFSFSYFHILTLHWRHPKSALPAHARTAPPRRTQTSRPHGRSSARQHRRRLAPTQRTPDRRHRCLACDRPALAPNRHCRHSLTLSPQKPVGNGNLDWQEPPPV